MLTRTAIVGRCAVAMISLALAACAGASGTMPSDAHVVLNERVTLAVGQSVTFGADSALRITFREIAQDSRCPVDAQCVWAGDAAVVFRVESRGTRRGTRIDDTTLHTHLEPQRIVISNEFALHLVSLSPENRAGTPTAPDAYRATIEVTTPD